MRKIIVIGECVLDIVFPQEAEGERLTAEVMPGGRLLNSAVLLGDRGRSVTFMGEVARDFTGDMILRYLERHNVDVKPIDRFTGGATPVNLIRGNDASSAICMRSFPEDEFDDIWPRVDGGDIVVFGSYFAISGRARKRLKEFLLHACERKAIVVYVPGFLPGQSRRITHEMPVILENLELADMVVSKTQDLRTIFQSDEDEGVYMRNIDFYCSVFVNYDEASGEVHFFNGKERGSARIEGNPLSAEVNARVLGDVIESLIAAEVEKEDLDVLQGGKMREMLDFIGKRD